MLHEFTQWLFGLVKAFFEALWVFLADLFVFIAELIVGALVTIIGLIPVPEFLSQGLGAVYAQMSPGVIYLLSATGLPAALAIIGSGYAFRLARKFLTLFQW